MSTPTARTFEEWWEAKGRKLSGGVCEGMAREGWNAAAPSGCESTRQQLAQARAEGYAQAKEDAAQVAERYETTEMDKRVAAAIRALKPKTDA